jgi:hypothetical protein
MTNDHNQLTNQIPIRTVPEKGAVFLLYIITTNYTNSEL